MLRAYLVGARAAARRWPLVAVLWLIAAAFGLAFALAAGVWLNAALDNSLATGSLLYELDAEVFVDLWYHHGEGLQGLALLAAALAVVHVVLWWWLDGVVLAALQRPSDEPIHIWTRGLELAPVMARLFAVAVAVLAIFSGMVGGIAYALMRWTRSSPGAMVWYQIGGVAALAWIVGAVFLVAVHDHARIRACRTGRGALASYGWACAFVWHGGERAFPLACLLQLSALALVAAYRLAGLSFSMTAILGLTGALVWGEVFQLVRLWVRVWFYAAQNELHTQ